MQPYEVTIEDDGSISGSPVVSRLRKGTMSRTVDVPRLGAVRIEPTLVGTVGLLLAATDVATVTGDVPEELQPAINMALGIAEAYELLSREADPVEAFTSDREPIVPGDDDVLDDLLRRWDLTNSAEETLTPPRRTVAVVHRLPKCGWCDAVARYDTYLQNRRGERLAGDACSRCTSRYGDPFLGPGHGTYLMLTSEVPDQVRHEIERLAAAQGSGPPLSATPDPEWMLVYRGLGFDGPDDSERMTAWFDDVILVATLADPGVVSLDLRIRTERSWGETDYRLPVEYPAEAVKHVLRSALRDWLPKCPASRVDELLPLPLDQALAITRSAMNSGTYAATVGDEAPLFPGRKLRWPTWDTYMRAASLKVADSGTDPQVLAEIIERHPDHDVRRRALLNPACPPESLLATTTSTDIHILLSRESAPDVVVAAAAEAVVSQSYARGAFRAGLEGDSAGRRRLAGWVLCQPGCPQELVPPLVELCRSDPAERVLLADKARGMEPVRRDLVHTLLLTNARWSQVARDTLDAILGPDGIDDEETVDRLLRHPDRRVRSLAQRYIEQLRQATRAGHESPASADAQAPGGQPSTARLRRTWATETLPFLLRMYPGLGTELQAAQVWRAGPTLHVDLHGEPLRAVTADGKSPLDALAHDIGEAMVEPGVEQIMPTLQKRRPKPVPMGQSVYHPRDYSTNRWDERTRRFQRTLLQVLDRAHDADHQQQMVLVLKHLAVAALGHEGAWLVTDDPAVLEARRRVPGLGAQLALAAQSATSNSAQSHVEVDPHLFAQLPPLLV